jgi:hypothetical protein
MTGDVDIYQPPTRLLELAARMTRSVLDGIYPLKWVYFGRHSTAD